MSINHIFTLSSQTYFVMIERAADDIIITSPDQVLQISQQDGSWHMGYDEWGYSIQVEPTQLCSEVLLRFPEFINMRDELLELVHRAIIVACAAPFARSIHLTVDYGAVLRDGRKLPPYIHASPSQWVNELRLF